MASYIYGLIDPITQELRYVGKTKNLKRRYRGHVKDFDDTHKSRWIKRLISLGRSPEMFVIEEVGDDNWSEAERFWISYFKFVGCNLANEHDGGRGGYTLSDETRQKLSAIGKSDRSLERISKTLHSDESKRKAREKSQDPSRRQEFAERNKKSWELHKAAIMEALRSDSRRMAISVGNIERYKRKPHARKYSDDQIRTIRESYWSGEMNTRELSEKYSMAQSGVTNIINKRTYKDVV